MSTDQAARLNREAWDSFRRQRDEGLVGGRRDVVERLVEGGSFLSVHHRELVGDVHGKRLLDLGCGDGGELISWARLGAQVVGVDNSPRQLTVARRAAEAVGIGAEQCRLVLADLLAVPEGLLRGDFDVAFSSGVLSWIGDLDRWFAAVSRALKPHGVFVLGAVHPLALYYRERERGAQDWHSYFDQGPFTEQLDATHRWNPAGDAVTTVQWMHTLGHVITSVAQAGFRVSRLLELPDEAEVYGVTGGPGEFLLRAIKV
ncbi:MAG: class I SAM-dependent methyltransferase [Chloroflexi bacterium]|nr:class I SAM-dependent methyltransferase [Chloroflexota bacterium]